MDVGALAAGRLVSFFHPGIPTVGKSLLVSGRSLGASCESQCWGYLELALEFAALGMKVAGVSSQRPDPLGEFSTRAHLPFELLSDEMMHLGSELELPYFVTSGGWRVYERVTLIARNGVVEKVFHPVSEPGRDARRVLLWLYEHGFGA